MLVGVTSTKLPNMHRPLALILLCLSVFFIVVTLGKECGRPVLGPNVEVHGIQKVSEPGTEVILTCSRGHKPVLGQRTIICSSSGEWTATHFTCKPKKCPHPDIVSNGEVLYEDTVYQSTITYTCDEGHVLHGASNITCQDDGTWNASAPECKPVTCGPAPKPLFGFIVYDRKISGNTTQFGLGGTYKCSPPFALIGNKRGECTSSGKWTEPPVCQMVTCPPPQPIDHGYMSTDAQRDFDFMEIIKYDCHGDYVIDQRIDVVCQATGQWSERPVCKAPCLIGIQRARILYNGNKLWMAQLNSQRIRHGEIISFYCKNEARNCGFAVPTQCIDGKLEIPQCFEEPSWISYQSRSGSLPSEIQQC